MNREEKKKATRKRILDAAMRLFSENGYESATVQQITELAGVAKGTFFNYFHSKEAVMCDLQGFWAIDEIRKLAEKPGPYVPQMKSLLVELVHRMQLSRPLARALLQGTLSSRSSLTHQIEILQEVFAATVPVFSLGQLRGEFNRKYAPEMMAQMAVQSFFGVLLFWAMEQGDDHLGEQMALGMELFFDGIKNGV